MPGLQIDAEVTGQVRVATIPGGPRSYNYVLTVDPDSPRNKETWGAIVPSGQFIVNGIPQIPAGIDQKVTITIGDSMPPVQTSGRVPASQRQPDQQGRE